MKLLWRNSCEVVRSRETGFLLGIIVVGCLCIKVNYFKMMQIYDITIHNFMYILKS